MIEFRRNPRLYKEQAIETRPLRPLPVTPVKQKKSVLSRALYPVIMLAAYGLMFYFNQSSPTLLIFPLIMLIPALVVPAIDDRQNWKETMEAYTAEMASYYAYLEELDLELSQIKQAFQLWNGLNFPGPKDEFERCKTVDSTLWCKRAEYSDFMTVCLGTYSAQFPILLVVDYPQMALNRDDAIKTKIQELLDKYSTVPNSPLTVNLAQHPCLGISNNGTDSTQECVAAILLSALYSYGYDEFKIMVLAKEEASPSLAEGKYQWIRWLPHCWDEDKKIRYFATSDSEKSNLLSYLSKICQEREQTDDSLLPHYLILVEDIEYFEKHEVKRYFTQTKNHVGVSILFISDSKGIPSESESVLCINGSQSTFINASMFGITEVNVLPRSIETFDVEELARFFSSIRLADDRCSNDLPSLVTLFDLYGEKNLSPERIAYQWSKNQCYTDGIHAVVGMKSSKDFMDLDMSDDHDGAHMLVAGTTGSGKSEFLQTFIVALSARYSPVEISFVFIDFKEGGMSEAFRGLPHNAGSLTNIDEEIDYLARRAITMLTNERKRRAKILEPYGQNINRYHEAYHESNQSLIPLPHLFIIIDEFAEVISQCSEFKEMIISLSRVGRSLGIHLILATQSPSHSVDSQIWSNSNCKICLKVLNEEESQAVLKTKDAAYIQTRGRAFCLIGSKSGLTEFQTAWSGAPTSTKFMATKIEIVEGISERRHISKDPIGSYTTSTQLSQVCSTCFTVKERAGIDSPHIVLTPSLPIEIKLREDSRKLFSLHVPKAYMGVGDYIYDHKQEEVPIWFGNGNNHIMISGNPNSGRSNAIGQLIRQLEYNCNASDIQFIIIQYGSKSLKIYRNSPVVAEYITNLIADISEADEKIGRTLTFIRDIIKDRQSEYTETVTPRLVLVVDGWNQLSEAYEYYREELLSIMSLNPAQYGVHFIIITGVDQIGFKLNPYFDTKLLMKYDKSNMSIDDISFEGSVLQREGRALFYDTITPYAIEIQTYDEVESIKSSINHSSVVQEKLKIPTFKMAYAQRGSYARELYFSTNGNSILLGMCKKTLEWIELSFEYRGIAVSYVDVFPKNAFIRYVMDSFQNHEVVLLEEESHRHYFKGNIITSNDPDSLMDWAETITDNTIIIIDYPGLAGNDCSDYSNIKMYPWQESLRNMMVNGKILIIWIEHVSRARNNSFFSDAISSFQKRIALGGRGERHPYFGDRIDSANIYLDASDAFVSLEGTDSMVIRTMVEL